MATGAIFKNINEEIQIDGNYKNYSVWDSGTYSTADVLFDEVVSPPLFAAKVVTTGYSGPTNVMVGTSKITKPTGSNAWDGNIHSRNSLISLGSMEFVPMQTDKLFAAGLDYAPSTLTSYTTMDYAIYCDASAGLSVYESGTLQYSGGSYAAGDVLSVVWDGSDIMYKKNGSTFRTKTGVTVAGLQAVVSAYHTGLTITGMKQVTGASASRTQLDTYGTMRHSPENFIGYTVINGSPYPDIDWAVFIEQPATVVPDYGMLVNDAKGELVFSSGEKYFRIVGIYDVYHASGLTEYDDVTVVDAVNNYFFLLPGVSGEACKRIDSATVRVEYIVNFLYEYTGKLIEIGVVL